MRLTYEDLALLPDDHLRHEIIDGIHYTTPSRTLRHQRMVGRLVMAIDNYLEVYPAVGEVVLGPIDVVFTRWDVVAPDLVFVAADQLSIVTEPNIQGAPALIVEVVSEDTKERDLGIKKTLFDRAGVREYWIVDPKANTVAIHRRADNGGFPKAQSLPNDAAAITTPLLPGFSLTLEKLFRP